MKVKPSLTNSVPKYRSAVAFALGRNLKQHRAEVWTDFLVSEYNLEPVIVPCNEQFQFGSGHVEKASKKHPSLLEGKYRGVLDQASVNLKCPQLLSKGVMKTWNVDIRLGKSVTFINELNVEIPFNERDILIKQEPT